MKLLLNIILYGNPMLNNSLLILLYDIYILYKIIFMYSYMHKRTNYIINIINTVMYYYIYL